MTRYSSISLDIGRGQLGAHARCHYLCDSCIPFKSSKMNGLECRPRTAEFPQPRALAKKFLSAPRPPANLSENSSPDLAARGVNIRFAGKFTASMSPPPATERRRSRRRKPSQLVYLEFGKENGGMVKDVSEGGMRFYLINPVAVGQSLHFSVNLDTHRRVEGQALMVWTDAGGKSGGMSFSELSTESRETLRAWLAEIDSPLTADAGLLVHTAEPSTAPDPIAPAPIGSHFASTSPTVSTSVTPVPPAPRTVATTPGTPRVVAPALAPPALVEATPSSPAPAAANPVAPHAFTPALAVAPPIASAPVAPEPVTARVPSGSTAGLP